MAVRTGRNPGAASRSDRGAAADSRRGLRTLRVGVIGLGVGEQHARGYAAHSSCELAVLCDREEGKLEQMARKFEGVERSASAEEVIASPEVDVVSIASFDADHGRQVIAALEHGKHVFVEKPLCTTVEEALAIRDVLRRNPRLKLSSNLVLRRSPRMVRLKQLINAGEFGTLFHVQGDYLYGRLHKLTDGWRGQDFNYSVILGGAVHLVDLLLWLTGGRATHAAGFGNRIASQNSVVAVNDMAAATLQFESGMTAIITANFGCVLPHSHGLSIFGTQATFTQNAVGAWLHRSRESTAAPELVTEPHPGVGKDVLVGDFIDAIIEDREPAVTAEEIFSTLAVCLAIDRAIATQSVVAVEKLT